MKFSVTIPAYKSQFLQEAVMSVVDQEYADWELIVVDDCSPGNLEAIVKPFLSDDRVRYYRNNKNCGAVDLVDNWNRCLSYCTGDYVICMGDDDRLLPCCLEEYRKTIERHPGLHVYHAWTQIINENGEVVSLQEPRPEWESALSLIWNRWNSRNKQFIGDFCYSVNYLKTIGGYFKLPLAWGTDDITAVLAAEKAGIANTQVFCFQYRESSMTISSSTDNAQLKIKLTLAQYNWFSVYLKKLSAARLSFSDEAYLKTISVPRRKYYFDTCADICIRYVRGNPVKLVWCYRQLKPFHFPMTTYIKWYIYSLLK